MTTSTSPAARPITRDENDKLFWQLHHLEAGSLEHRRLRGHIIERNLGLAYQAALRWRSRGRELEDLQQAALVGLCVAVDQYDVTKGFAFSTYARHWLFHYLQRHVINNVRTVRLSGGTEQQVAAVRRVESRLRHEYGYEPDAEQLVTGLQRERTKPPGGKWTVESVEELQRVSRLTLSLDRKYGDGDNTYSLMETVADDDVEDEFEAVLDRDDLDALWRDARKCLTDLELAALEARFSFGTPEFTEGGSLRKWTDAALHFNEQTGIPGGDRVVQRYYRTALAKLRSLAAERHHDMLTVSTTD